MKRPEPDWFAGPINRVAETQFHIRHQLLRTLETVELTQTGQELTGGATNYREFWERTLGPQFFDIGTLIRLGTVVETLLRDYYRICSERPSNRDLTKDRGVFQRVFPWSNNNVIDLYNADIDYDLSTNPELPAIQRLMANRHLYAHSSGLSQTNTSAIGNVSLEKT